MSNQKSIKTRLAARFRFNPLFKKGLELTGTELKPHKWIFIIGCYNSGTTLLSTILSQHPNISAMEDEGTILSGYLNRPEDFGWQRMWVACESEVSLDDSLENQALAQKIKKHWSHFLSTDPNKVLLEKSIVNTTRLPFLNAFFQPAYFIYLVRNGYAVAEGIQRKANPGKYENPVFKNKYTIEQCAKQWQRTHEVVEQYKSKCLHFYQVYYEDLTENPQEVLKSVTDFLELAPLPKPTLTAQYKVHELDSFISNQNHESIKRLSLESIDKIKSVASDALHFHNYFEKYH